MEVENTENHTCLGTKFDRICTIKIDDRFYGDAYLFNGSVVSSSYTIPTFANNDGFDTPDELFAYFNKNFKIGVDKTSVLWYNKV